MYSIFKVPILPQVQLTGASRYQNFQSGDGGDENNGNSSRKIQRTHDYEQDEIEEKRTDYE